MSTTATIFALVYFSERLDLQHLFPFVSAGVRDVELLTSVESHTTMDHRLKITDDLPMRKRDAGHLTWLSRKQFGRKDRA